MTDCDLGFDNKGNDVTEDWEFQQWEGEGQGQNLRGSSASNVKLNSFRN